MRSVRTGLALLALGIAMPSAAQAQLAVDESAIALDVIDRMPVGADSTFTADVERVYFWTRISGAPEGGTTIHHVWIHGGQEMADLELNIGAPSWRTWSNKAIMEDWTGDWRVEVRDDAGNVLATVRFTVQ